MAKVTEPQSDGTMVVECCGVLEELCGGSEYRLRLPRFPISVAELIERLALSSRRPATCSAARPAQSVTTS